MLNPKVNKSILACYGTVLAFIACKVLGFAAAKLENNILKKVSGWVNNPWISSPTATPTTTTLNQQ